MSAMMTTGPSEVRVRMYRQGLGDCFLLAFPTKTERPFTMLIDCGVIVGTGDATDKMTRVASQIREATGGHLDVLVATHEHWDHLSGFVQAEDVFKGMQIDRIWLAWTENPNDDQANQIRTKRLARLSGLRAAVDRYRKTNLAAAERVESVLHFFGDALGVGGGPSTGDALKSIRVDAGGQERKVEYHTPGERPLTLPGVEGVKIYILGPPRDEKLLKRSDPTKRGHEVYEQAMTLDLETAFLAAVKDDPAAAPALSSLDQEQRELTFPFDASYRISPDQAKSYKISPDQAKGDMFFARYYGFEPDATPDGPEWRRIDDDWLQGAGALALQLDSDTNNTSLAMAIELPDGKVLLFPADAQVGNWLSWHTLEWKPDGADDRTPPITAPDLLARTVLYKVGHHGSHNATLREKGLMMMTHPELAAMIPVNQEMALKKRWSMPFAPLRSALEERTRGRLMLVDEGVPLKTRPSPRLSDAEREAFLACVVDQDTPADNGSVGYIEYRMTMSSD